MAADTLTIKVTTRVKGLWKIALLGWAIKRWRLGPQHVEITAMADPL